MKRSIGALLMAVALVGCGTSPSKCSPSCPAVDQQVTPADQTVSSIEDLTLLPDQSVIPDLMPPPLDFTAGMCAVAGDCRLYSSYCSNFPCVCFVLTKADPDPPCEGGTVTCFADPCLNHTAACDINDLGVKRCIKL